MTVTRQGWIAYGLAAAIIASDQASKYWILEVLRLPEYGTQEVFWPLQFTRIWNEGISFGLFQAGNDLVRWGMVVFNFGVAALLSFWARSQVRLLPAVGLGLLIGGAIGNAIDRALFGAVVDFIDVQRLGFFPWIFNIADSGITVGIILFLLDSLRRDARPDALAQKPD
ncbi:signal peptidase II [uncultured Phenylobacterium sp.]|uniref:signal peptidase II n=1 Tax=uncultured Phenylobacterium sp. TaxID=349273 RepID=UPI0025EC5A87|nr:signal peptidase II [uncultured Phenylobacterium sp.]